MRNNNSGLLLMSLLENGLQGIMRREAGNETSAILYRTGDYWAAFERSAYQLKRLYPCCTTYPMLVATIPYPIVIATLPLAELDAAADMHPEEEHTVIPAPKISIGKYAAWHRRKEQALAGLCVEEE